MISYQGSHNKFHLHLPTGSHETHNKALFADIASTPCLETVKLHLRKKRKNPPSGQTEITLIRDEKKRMCYKITSFMKLINDIKNHYRGISKFSQEENSAIMYGE